MVFLACDKMSQGNFVAIGEQIVDVKRVHKRDLILSGKAGSLPSTARAVGQQQPESSG
jgi:hypothetical protein